MCGASVAFANRTLPSDDNGRPVQAGSYMPAHTTTFYVTKKVVHTLPADVRYLGFDFKCTDSNTQVSFNDDGNTWIEPEGDYIKNDLITSIAFQNTSTAAPGNKCVRRVYGGQR